MRDNDKTQPPHPALEHIRAVKRAHQEILLQKANVIGLAIGYRTRADLLTDELALIVLVDRKYRPEQLSPEDLLPAEIDGVPLDVQQVGDIKAHGPE